MAAPAPAGPVEDLNGYRSHHFTGFDAEKDADALHNAMKGLGTTDSVLIDIMPSRTAEEMWKIGQAFQAKYHGELAKWLKDDTSGAYQDALVALAMTPVAFDAMEMYTSMKGLGTRESTLIDVLVTRSNAELQAVKQAYTAQYGKDLAHDIKGDTSGKFEKGLLMLCEAQRSEDYRVNQQLADSQAMELYKAGEKAWGTDTDRFLNILCRNSVTQNMAVSEAYAKHTSKHTLEHAIRSETSGDLEDLLIALVNPARFLAERFHKAVTGIDTKEKRLIALGRRANKPLLRRVKTEYRKMYKSGLVADIENATSGDFLKVMRRMLCCSQADYSALRLREAMRGLGCDDKVLIEVLGNPQLTRADQALISECYERDYGHSLRSAISSETHNNFCKALVSLATPVLDLKAEYLYKAMKGLGTKESALIEVITTTSSDDLEKIKVSYNQQFKQSVIEDVKGDTSGDFEKILVKLLTTKRAIGLTIKEDKAKELAVALYKGGEGRFGTNDDLFISTFTTLSPEDLALVDQAYQKQYGHPLSEAVRKETSGHYRETLYACLNPEKYACQLLHKSMKGLGTDDDSLIRIITTRDPAGLKRLSDMYGQVNGAGQDMKEMITGDTSGHYRDLLLNYCGFIRR